MHVNIQSSPYVNICLYTDSQVGGGVAATAVTFAKAGERRHL